VESSAIVVDSGKQSPDITSKSRYKKCGIICADVKCRYIPTRSEIRELQGRGHRQCYTCQGNVIVRGDGVECRV
jgi:hypothetical protein